MKLERFLNDIHIPSGANIIHIATIVVLSFGMGCYLNKIASLIQKYWRA
jgi:hypothetical protein